MRRASDEHGVSSWQQAATKTERRTCFLFALDLDLGSASSSIIDIAPTRRSSVPDRRTALKRMR